MQIFKTYFIPFEIISHLEMTKKPPVPPILFVFLSVAPRSKKGLMKNCCPHISGFYIEFKL